MDEDFDVDGDGVSACAGDCDDENPLVAPGNLDTCLPGDNDCDGSIDEDVEDCESNCPIYIERSDTPAGQTNGSASAPFPSITAAVQNSADCAVSYTHLTLPTILLV